MSNEDGKVWITYNGEIYNHAQFRAELEKAGHVFKTDHSDTEIMVHGLRSGASTACCERMSGDFALRHPRCAAKTRSTWFATASA